MTDSQIEDFAFDRSVRHVDVDGRLHVTKSHISKAGINPYYGKEIPGWKELGLDPEKIYRLFRDPKELEKGAQTFANLPILKKHVPVSVDKPEKELIVGAIGSDVSFNDPYLDSDLCFWDAEAIAGIDNDKVKELSCAYRYVPIMESGEFKGQPYDGRMTNIRGNHLALVEVGRAGSDVVVSDKNPFTPERKIMKMTKLGKAIYESLCAASPKLAADSAFQALVADANKASFKKADITPKILAMDEDLNPQKVDNVIDALLDVEQPNPAKPKKQGQDDDPLAKKDEKDKEKQMPKKTEGAADDEPVGKLRKMLTDGGVDSKIIEDACSLFKPAKDAKPEEKPEDGEKEVKAAMDSALKSLRDQLLAAEQAKNEVRKTVGDVLGMDSAADVYGFALDQMGVDHKGISDVAALRAIFKIASTPASHASVSPRDSGGLEKMFPAVARIRNA
jgi:hypothetical protein